MSKPQIKGKNPNIIGYKEVFIEGYKMWYVKFNYQNVTIFSIIMDFYDNGDLYGKITRKKKKRK